LNIAADICRIADQERCLRFARFDLDLAWQLGTRSRDIALARAMPLVIELRIPDTTVFHSAMRGTAPANADWARRKRNRVEFLHRSSYGIGLPLKHEALTLEQTMGLSVQDRLAAGAGHIRDDIGQLDVHLDQGLLHGLHAAGLGPQQRGALAGQCAQHADLVTGPEGATQQPIAHELLQPLAVEHVALAPADVLDVPSIDPQYVEAAAVEPFEQRDPVHAGGLHCYRVHAASGKPVGKTVEIGSERGVGSCLSS
jgi:uncharacterized protein (UPF0303 family)